MYELVQAGPNTFYIECPAKIGVWRESGTEVYLIDSGNDKDAGRKVLKILGEQGWTLKAILNTHSNADHVGGNRYLQEQTGCRVFANGAEAALTRQPLLEPSLVYGGYPFAELRNKFLMAQPSGALDIGDSAFPQSIEIIPLPGHFIDMVGFRTPDDTMFLADCVTNAQTLSKYHITFLYDIAAQLQTLDAVEAMQAKLFIPSHAEACADIKSLVKLNRAKLLEIADRIVTLCHTPLMFEELLQKLFTHYQLAMNATQYVLVGSTVRSYLSWLKDTGRLAVSYENGRMLWQKA